MFELRVGGASNDVSSIAASSTLVVLAALVVAAAFGAWWCDRHLRLVEGSLVGWFAGFTSVALIVSVTLFREGLPGVFDVGGLGDWSSDGLRRLSRDPLGSSQFVLNIVLFIPAGLAWTWVTKRPFVTLGVLSATSVVIESIQAVTGAGANDVADLVANSIGAAVGAGFVGMINVVFARGVRLSRRSQWFVGVSAAVVAMASVAGCYVGASSRQQNVEDALRAEFEGTDRADIEMRLDLDPDGVFGALSDFADGTRYSEDRIEIRYPATFFSLHRCVYAVWDSNGVEFKKASGHACTDFIDG